MRRSFNELKYMIKSAARGAGYSWGMAEECAYAAVFLERNALSGARLVAGLLENVSGCDMADFAPKKQSGYVLSQTGVLCPVAAGVCICDHVFAFEAMAPIRLRDVYYPLLLVPFLAQVSARIRTPLSLSWNKVTLLMDGEKIAYDVPQNSLYVERVERLECVQSSALGNCNKRINGCWICETDWLRLRVFAHKIYAPATDESRMTGAGAGAGVHDND